MKTIMKLRILLPLLLLLGCQPSSRKDAISRQLQDYPESRVQDIYKSFCQDNLGPGHLIPDADAARNYLNAELASFRNELDSLGYTSPAKAYCPVGDLGNYVHSGYRGHFSRIDAGFAVGAFRDLHDREGKRRRQKEHAQIHGFGLISAGRVQWRCRPRAIPPRQPRRD